MEFLEIATSLIGSIGFPIAACVGLFWYMLKQTRLIEEMRQTIERNTDAIQKLAQKLTEVK